MEIDSRQAVLALGNAVDLVGVDDVLHGRRVAVMAAECASHLKWNEARKQTLFDAGILHDCGVSSTRVHSCLVNELDWEGSAAHCQQGFRLLKDYAPLAHLAPLIRYHHMHWDEMLRQDIASDIALSANLIYLVDRVDALAAPWYAGDAILQHAPDIRNVIARHRGSFFAPELVDAFLETSRLEAFWLLLNPDYITHYITLMARHRQPVTLSPEQLKQFAVIIATIVDAKSPYTADHSFGVARLSRQLGEWAGFSGDTLDKIEIAGLLHDIGKLQIPDDLLESPTPFSPQERLLMKKHSFVTWQILTSIEGLTEIAFLAAAHHESLNGNGYPFHYGANELPMEARVIKVADIFHALAQKRPYREPAQPGQIMGHFTTMVADNEIDPTLVEMVANHLDAYYVLAQQESEALRPANAG